MPALDQRINMDNGKKRKVMCVLKSSEFSGAENVVLTIIKYLQNQYDFLYVATEGSIRERLEDEKIPFYLMRKFNWYGLYKIINRWKPDIVHAHDFSASTISSLIPGNFRLISHLHYDPPWTRKWNLKTVLYCILGKRFAKILIVTATAYENMIFANIFRSKTIVVGNPINQTRIKRLAESETICEHYDLIFVGRLVEQKNPLRFIDLVKQLNHYGCRVNAAMLGSGDLELLCKEKIEHDGLKDAVHLLGFQSNPYSYISSSKILCMPSRWEGYGLVLLEANILGVPVVSSPTAGAKAVLGADSPELCESDEDFLKKIMSLLDEPIIYESWSHRSEERVANIPDIEDYVKRLVSIYQCL